MTDSRLVEMPPGPFDILGDVHGCASEFVELMQLLGYDRFRGQGYRHPAGRTLVLVGDLVDRGPSSIAVLDIALDMVESGSAIWVQGNHDNKFYRWLKGNPVKIGNGLRGTIEQFVAASEMEQTNRRTRIMHCFEADQVHPYVILDGGRLVVSHAGIKSDMIGRYSSDVRAFCLYGDVDNEALKDGVLIRRDWAEEYDGEALIVYGHTVVPQPLRKNNTINIDTGCCFGGHLTAYRYPEHEIVSVKAHAVYDPSKIEDGILPEYEHTPSAND